MAIPQAGHDKQWLKDRTWEIHDRADDGDEGFRDLIDEVKMREDMRDVASFWKSKLGLLV